MRDLITDIIGVAVLATLLIVFGTNAVTEDYNFWALLAQFGNRS